MRKHIRAWILLFFALSIAGSTIALADANENKEIIHAYLTDEYGLNCAAACGILSNIRSESNFNPEAIGDGGDAYGICQWNSRRQSLINYCENNGFESWKSLEGQLGYLVYELENNKKSVGNYLKALPNTAQGAYDSAYYFCVYYEIPANRYAKGVTRGTNAVNIYWKGYGGSIETYTVTYNANGGKNAPAAATKKEGVPLVITSISPTRAGYTHIGWSKSKTGSVDFTSGDTYSDNSDITLYAVWEKSLEADTQPDISCTVNGHTYEYYKGGYTWTNASVFAAGKGGYLASVQSTDEYEAISALISEAEGACWLGGRYANGNWMWESGEMFWDDFAEGKWAQSHPGVSYGDNANGRLAQSTAGKWLDLPDSSADAGGFIVEYGDPAEEEFPIYLITVSTSLNLRSGPGTSYASLGYLFPDMTITIYETYPGSSYNWGWGVSSTGTSGWCAMRIPEYMRDITGITDESGIVYQIENDEAIIVSYKGTGESLEIPAMLASFPVVRIQEYAFTDESLKRITVPEQINQISDQAFKEHITLASAAGSAAHRYAVTNNNPFMIIKPDQHIMLPDGLKALEEGAFTGTLSAEFIDLSNTVITHIPSGAFADADKLSVILLPDTVTSIALDAFDADAGILFVCKPGSVAETRLKALGFETIAYGN